jgi:Ni/Co efflux regulator RcnB
MKLLIASLVTALFAAGAFAQTPAAPADKAHANKKPVSVKKVPPATKRQAIEEATPTEDADPSEKLSAAELEIAKRIHTGDIQCELGQKVSIKPMKRDGFFFVSRGVYKYVMHPVESRTGAIRLEDPVRGALWLQLGNKSMLMNQKEGKRLADDCVSPEQADFARNMKPVNLLEPGK